MSERVGGSNLSGWCYFACILLSVQFASPLTCPPGNFYSIDFSVSGTCEPCPDNSFMPDRDHQEKWCNRCKEIKDLDLEILVSPCNKTHDAVIHCVDGYFRDLPRNPRETGKCQKCANCSDHSMSTGHPCSTYTDTTCCLKEEDDPASNHDDKRECREISRFCSQGQYFDTSGFQCLPCPSNTFMPEDFHAHAECLKCGDNTTFEANSPLGSTIVQPCSSTHDTVLSCVDGYYIKPTMRHGFLAIGCSRCTNCSATDFQYEGRKCDDIHDTVCCPQASMTVEDTPDGPRCKPLSPTAVATTETTPKNENNTSDDAVVLAVIIGILSGLTTLAVAMALFKLYIFYRSKNNSNSGTSIPASLGNKKPRGDDRKVTDPLCQQPPSSKPRW